MFGEKAGDEQFQGELNQYVVSKLIGDKKTFWVFHKRSEVPTSILIHALTNLKTHIVKMVAIVSSIKKSEQLDEKSWQALSDFEIEPWYGSKQPQSVKIHEQVNSGTATSRMLGVTSEEKDQK